METLPLIFCTCVLVTSTVVSSQQLLSVEPKRAVLVAGQHLELTCASLSSEPRMKWTLDSLEHGTSDVIADGNNVVNNERFSVTVSETESQVISVLRINSVSLMEGGLFRCEDLTQPSVAPKLASIVVLGSEPMCSTTPEEIVEGDAVTSTCKVQVNGQWRPSVEWTGPRGIIPETELTEDHLKDLVSVSYSFLVDRTMDGVRFSSRVYFADPQSDPLPYQFTHHFQPLRVLYPSVNITISPIKDVYKPGDRVLCQADGKPAPSFEWRDDESINRCQGATLLITRGMEGHRSFSCVASSEIRNHIVYARSTMKLFVHVADNDEMDTEEEEEGLCVMHPMEIIPTDQEGLTTDGVVSADTLESKSEDSAETTHLITIAVISACFLLLIVGIACYCTTKRKMQKQSLESVQNLNNDVYLRTCGGEAQRGPGHAQPNQYATAFGVHDPEAGIGLHLKKNQDEEDDDNSSGFYSELIVPEDLPLKKTPETVDIQKTPELPAKRRNLSQISQDIGEDGYMLPQIQR